MGAIVSNCINLSPVQRYDSVRALKNVIQAGQKTFKEPPAVKREKMYHENWLPGFRSGNYAHMLIAVTGYGLIGLLCMGLEIKSSDGTVITGIELALEKAAVASGCLIVVAFATNYRKMREYFPFQKSERKEVRVIAGIIEGFLLFWAAFLFFVLLLVVFGS